MYNYDIISFIEGNYENLSKGHKKIANYILEHYEKAAFLTATKLGMAVGKSESTVVRFAMAMGFEGYMQFQQELRKIIKNRLTSVQRMDVVSDLMDGQNVLRSVMSSDMESIKRTIDGVNGQSFENAVEALLKANKIYILGVRSSAVLADFLALYFNIIFNNVQLVHTNSISEMFEQILRIEKNDVVIGISFPRYSVRTINALEYAKDKGSTVVAITDIANSPITKHADHILTAFSDLVSLVDSLVAPLSLINALIVAVVMRKKGEVYKTLENLEDIWDEYGVYEKLNKRTVRNMGLIHEGQEVEPVG